MSNPAVVILQAEKAKKQAQLEEAVALSRGLRAEIKALEDAISVLGASSSAPLAITHSGRNGSHDDGRPQPLKFVIAQILAEHPGLTPAELIDALGVRGRPTGLNTVLGTLSRARKEGLVYKSGRGWQVAACSADVSGVCVENKSGSGVPEPDQAGDVAERFIAPELESGGAFPEQTAPVGSNPTVSAYGRRAEEENSKPLLSAPNNLRGQ